MGSSTKKKKDKKKDFQVSDSCNELLLLTTAVETKIKSWENSSQSRQFHGYQLQIQMYVSLVDNFP